MPKLSQIPSTSTTGNNTSFVTVDITGPTDQLTPMSTLVDYVKTQIPSGGSSDGNVGDVQFSDGSGGFVGGDSLNFDSVNRELRVADGANHADITPDFIGIMSNGGSPRAGISNFPNEGRFVFQDCVSGGASKYMYGVSVFSDELTQDRLQPLQDRDGSIALIGDGSNPNVMPGAAAGTAPTINLSTNSDDVGGQISITTGTGAAAGVLVTVNFNQPYVQPAKIVFSASNAAAATNIAKIFISPGTTSFQINANGAISAGTQIILTYMVTP